MLIVAVVFSKVASAIWLASVRRYIKWYRRFSWGVPSISLTSMWVGLMAS